MKNCRLYLAVAAIVCSAVPGAANAQNAGLDKVLSEMDVASQRFHSAQADFTWDQYTAVVQDHDIQAGTTAFMRADGGLRMYIRIRTENGQPSPRELLYKNGELEYYQPQIKQETIFSAGSNREQYESFFTIGFGGSGKDLTAGWNVTYQGTETIDGVQTAKLDLVSKQADVKNNFSHITIWVDPTRSISLKQVFYTPSGDTRTVLYKDIRYNIPLPASTFSLQVAPGTQQVRK